MGKWIVAADAEQRASLERVAELCAHPDVDVPVRWVGRKEMQDREPDLWAEFGDEEGLREGGRAVLESPETGIVDSHALMMALLGGFEERGGEAVLGAGVVDVTPLGNRGSGGWEVDVVADGETTQITAEVLVNAAGHGAVPIHNLILGPSSPRRLEAFYAKGNYYSYHAPPTSRTPRVSRLIYPAPSPGGAGLGTHLTLDLAGQMRFGPDAEWVDSPDDLAVSVDVGRMEVARQAVGRYLPGVLEEGGQLQADYAGIRPKLGKGGGVSMGKGFVDFVIKREEGFEGWVNLLGIESPGLTSCLAIGERVYGLLYGGVAQR